MVLAHPELGNKVFHCYPYWQYTCHVYYHGTYCHQSRMLLQDMLASWRQPFSGRYGVQHGAHYYELSFVESAVRPTTSRHLPPRSVAMAIVVASKKPCFDLQLLAAVGPTW